jgi:hypothetical protein
MPEKIVHRDGESTFNHAPPTLSGKGGGGCPFDGSRRASHGQRPLSLRRFAQASVRSPSAVASTTVATSQRLDLLILKVPNAVSPIKRPSPLVRIE